MDEFDSNDFLLNQARNAFERDKIITQVISDFADHQRKRDQEQRKQKAAFFKIVCFSFCAVIVGSLAVIIIIATKQDMGWEELGVALASVGSLISAIIVLPSKIAEHLFPASGESDLTQFFIQIHDVDTRITQSSATPGDTVTVDSFSEDEIDELIRTFNSGD